MGFAVPFPESMDRYLLPDTPPPPTPHSSHHGAGSIAAAAAGFPRRFSEPCGADFAAEATSYDTYSSYNISTIVWPEARSASFLHAVLNEANGYPVDRIRLPDAITAHTVELLSGKWRQGNRCAALGMSFVYASPCQETFLCLACSSRVEPGQGNGVFPVGPAC